MKSVVVASSSYGGEILNYGNSSDKFTYQFFNENTLRLLNNYGIIKIVVILLLIVTALLILKSLYGIRGIFTSKSVRGEIDNFNDIRKRDLRILRTNKFIKTITNFVTSKGIRVNPSYKEYIQYNLDRANVRIPGGSRCYTPDEFNSLKVLGVCLSVIIGIIVAYFVSPIIGLLIICLLSIMCSVLPMTIVRRIVADKDTEIRVDFPDLYLMIHYEIVSGASTPLAKSFLSYKRVTKSKEMIEFVNKSVDLLETYGEIEATNEIAKAYREIPEVTRLMRLISQLHSGGNVVKELNGFRESIIKDKKYRIEAKMDKLVNKARASFTLAYVILIQAIVSAMFLFLPRMDMIKF